MSKQKNEQLEIDDYDEKTGEIKSGLNKPKFRSMWCNPYNRMPQDLSNEFEDTFTEIPPFTKDDKGNWLNDTSIPKLVPSGKINIQERIQSFKDDVDIYKILERFAYTGDLTLFSERPSYSNDIDISGIPNDLNSFNEYYNDFKSRLASLDPDLAKMILDDHNSSIDIELKAKSIFNDRVDKYNKAKQQKKEIEKKEEIK